MALFLNTDALQEDDEKSRKAKERCVDTRQKIVDVYDNHKAMLLMKNTRYGESALKPLGVFFKEDSDAGLRVRIDDKISRIKNAFEPCKNDVSDLMGYLVLYCVRRGWTNFEDLID